MTDRHLKVKEISEINKLSDIIVRRILQDHLGMHKVSRRWTVVVRNHVHPARDLFWNCVARTKACDRKITGDESMVLFYDFLSKRKSTE